MKLKAGILALMTLGASTIVVGQSITQIANSDPLIISGAIGTQNTFNYSSNGAQSTSMWNNTAFANLNFQVYGISIPFSFTYSNAGTGFSYPLFSFRINPTWRNWSLYVGKHTMAFNPYVYNVPVNGVGVEYRSNKLRFGAFYGELRKNINDDPLDPTARNPQYQRMGWGFKAGYGTSSRFIDLYIFRAKDRISSLDDRWYDKINPQENLVLGVKGRYGYKRLSVSANFATSFFTTDTKAQQLEKTIIGSWDKVFDARLTSLYLFAGDVAVSWGFRDYMFGANYKVVQPDYMTLGTNYICNNVQAYGINASGMFFKGRVSLNGTFSAQQDNITKRQIYTTEGYVYGATLSWLINNHLNFNGSYNGYRQRQTDGTEVVNDTIRVDRIMHGITGGLNYSLQKGELGHFVGLSYNYNKNLDLNPFNNGETDVVTNAAGVNYGLQVAPIGMTFNFGYNWQNSKDHISEFSTNMFTFGTNRSFLKENQLSMSLNANYSVNESMGSKTSSYGVSLSAGYTFMKSHIFSLSGSYNSYNNICPGWETSMSGKSYTVSLSYNYAFTLIHVKRKERQAEAQAIEREAIESQKKSKGRQMLEEFGNIFEITRK